MLFISKIFDEIHGSFHDHLKKFVFFPTINSQTDFAKFRKRKTNRGLPRKCKNICLSYACEGI